MGIIKATLSAIGGAFADSWQEVIEADNMSDTTLFTRGVKVRPKDKRNSNKKGTDDTISNGSIIHVYPNQFMILVDGGKVVDFTAEEGYYKVDNSSAPSLFAGQLGESIKDAFSRIKFGGVPSYSQKAYFINLQEIKGIRFGTRTPVNYFDNFYNAELFLRAHGTYSVRVTDPIKLYSEVIPKNADRVEVGQINEQYLSEFLEALNAALNKMSVDGIRVSHVASKSRELSQYMANELDASWKDMRGLEVQSVGIASVSYDEESKELINMRNKGAMLGDPSVREGYVQGAVARGIEAAGSNSAGSAQAFMGMGVGMNGAGSFMATASDTNRRQMESEKSAAPVDGWTCSCGNVNTGKFCSDCGAKKPENKGNFCTNCGAKLPAGAKFCSECGQKV